MSKFKEGEDHYIWDYHHGQEKHCLANATLNACDKCGKPATVNSVWIIGTPEPAAIEQANELQKEYGDMTELGADSEGSCFCEKCYGDNAVLEA